MISPATQSSCPHCREPLMIDALFCHHCGRQLQVRCANCGAGNPEGSLFCHRCGTRLPVTAQTTNGAAGGPAPSAPPADPAAQSPVAPGYPMYTPPAQPLEKRACPRCHSVNDPDSRFCYSCGLPLEGVAPVVVGGPLRDVNGAIVGTPAGFWVRAGAAILDNILLSIGGAVLVGVLGLNTELPPNPTVQDAMDFVTSTGNLVTNLLQTLYFVVGFSAFGTTIGKRVFSLYVVRPNGARVGPLRALARLFLYSLGSLLLFIGPLMIAFRKDKRGLHDLIADTYVVKR